MQGRKKIIVGNWKMNPTTIESAKEIFKKIKRRVSASKRVLTVICPSDIHLTALSGLAKNGNIQVGIQDVFWEDAGFFTGQISPQMAYSAGARFAILGHSEKRKLGETSEQVAKKALAVVRDKMVAIVCVGESERDIEGAYLSFLREEITRSLAGLGKKEVSRSIVIAYEPVWEIGRKDMKAMEPADIHETAIFIKKVVADIYGIQTANEVPILYGGSVSKDNAKDTVYLGEVDGLLVGRQSLDPEAFSAIISSVNEGK